MIRILVVDDEEEICNFLKEFLTGKKYEVFVATDAAQALELVREEHPQLVFLDIRMPQKDGVTLLQEIKAIDQTISVVMVSALQDEELARKTLALGAEGYITKPIDLEYLERNILVNRILQK